MSDREENIKSVDTLVAEELNNFFKNATKTLNINENSYIVDSSSSIIDPVDKAINKYKNHPSILLMKEKLENVDQISFKVVSVSEIGKQLRELNSNKATMFGNIPIKNFKIKYFIIIIITIKVVAFIKIDLILSAVSFWKLCVLLCIIKLPVYIIGTCFHALQAFCHNDIQQYQVPKIQYTLLKVYLLHHFYFYFSQICSN